MKNGIDPRHQERQQIVSNACDQLDTESMDYIRRNGLFIGKQLDDLQKHTFYGLRIKPPIVYEVQNMEAVADAIIEDVELDEIHLLRESILCKAFAGEL